MTLRPVSLAVMLMLAGITSTTAADEARRSYIVQLVDKPVATYTGQVAGLPATKPAEGQRLDVDATDVQNYITYLDTKKSQVLSTVSAAQVTHQFNVVFNGFSAMLTDAEVRALKKDAGVANITADSIMQMDTNYTPTFLGLDKAGGLWEQVGGKAAAGENIVIGIIDSGVWPENPSFADKVDADGVPSHAGTTLAYGAPPATWKGSCDTGEGFALSNCNNKLIGARYFKSPLQSLHWTEFNSSRDSVAGAEGHGGHGTHTATTAGGNANTPIVNGNLNLGKASGMAPRARIASYKVCWTDATSGKNGCATANSVAAIEQAVKDGVNVINFSIGPNAGGGAFNEATEVAFLGAASAGVFVAASGGNSGPSVLTPAPVSHISPWLTTVGNSSHNRLFVGTATLGNGVKLTGSSSNASTASAALILARDAGKAGVDPTNVQLLQCFGAADGLAALLDPAKVAGKILVCDRGANVLVNKSQNAKDAGAVGAIIANVAANNNAILNQSHALSTVHLPLAEGTTLKSYIAANPASAVASLGDLKGVVNPNVAAPVMSGSSSRGPNVANANILKPDVTAPGSDVLAGVTADLTKAQRDAVAAGGAAPSTDWAFYSGTSMASPHVAGLAALLKQLHPTWTPAMIKSALMTTANPTQPDGVTASVAWDKTAKATGTLPWGQGAGHVTPNGAANPGLVYDATEIDYARFLCGLNANVYSPATCQAVGTIQPYNLNLASLTAGNVLGSLTLTRTVTNVGSSTATYNATASVPGYTVDVQPPTLTIGAGQKATFKVKVTRTNAPVDTWVYGSLVWSDGVNTVRSPLTVRGSALAAAASVSSEFATGSKLITIGTGFTGAMTSVKSGLLPAVVETRSVGESGTDSAVYLAACRAGGGAGVNVHTVNVPASTMAARFALFNDDTAGGANSDLDLIVLAPNGTVSSSGNGGSNERVELVQPAAGAYKVCVIGYEPANGEAEYKLSSWVLPEGASNGNFKALVPAYSYVGGTGTVSMSWSGLAANQRHLGALRYVVNGATQGMTMVEVNTNDPLPQFDAPRRAVVLAK
ncbi:S8 family serine peptidase [Massilia atriviolacea]|uniref:Peptidase S8 and S53 subtilisin kexin sedolisin n=1 Tax=Massilia atriviolacea TaxID=2495579 RepID=A0A430HHC9_9BURK|nr:S8 family serine peptidase [Massilia atriviolacea]RSZ56906.1 peptidase S8 and S53 subtilisin kexin sedolisin [Massilia atriviolacea]